MELSSTFHHYFTSRVKFTVKELWSGPTPSGYFGKNWTNNNCESLNQVLKASINWESKPLLDLVTTLKFNMPDNDSDCFSCTDCLLAFSY